MKVSAIAAAITSLVTLCALSQAAPAAPDRPSISVVVQINRALNVKKLKANDRVTATLLQDLISAGRIVIPRNAKLIGRVAEVQATGQADSVARLALVFEKVDLKGGETMPVHGVIQAVAPPLIDPFLEAIMASSSSKYAGTQNGHPVSGGTGQINVPTPVVRPSAREVRAQALEQRQQALEDASKGVQSGPQGPRGALTAGSRGVFGFPGLRLRTTQPVPVLVSAGHDIELPSGTQIVLRLGGPPPQP